MFVMILIVQKVDVGVQTFSVTQSRSQVIDYAVAFTEEATIILAPAPTEGAKLFACLRPFKMEVIPDALIPPNPICFFLVKKLNLTCVRRP